MTFGKENFGQENFGESVDKFAKILYHTVCIVGTATRPAIKAHKAIATGLVDLVLARPFLYSFKKQHSFIDTFVINFLIY